MDMTVASIRQLNRFPLIYHPNMTRDLKGPNLSKQASHVCHVSGGMLATFLSLDDTLNAGQHAKLSWLMLSWRSWNLRGRAAVEPSPMSQHVHRGMGPKLFLGSSLAPGSCWRGYSLLEG